METQPSPQGDFSGFQPPIWSTHPAKQKLKIIIRRGKEKEKINFLFVNKRRETGLQNFYLPLRR